MSLKSEHPIQYSRDWNREVNSKTGVAFYSTYRGQYLFVGIIMVTTAPTGEKEFIAFDIKGNELLRQRGGLDEIEEKYKTVTQELEERFKELEADENSHNLHGLRKRRNNQERSR